LDVGHEVAGRDGVASWYIASTVRPDDTKVILHQVRHPQKTLSSFFTFEASSWGYFSNHLKIPIPRPVTLSVAMRVWLEWNTLAEQKASHTYRVESVLEELPELSEIIGFDLDRRIASKIALSDHTRVNRPEYRRITFADMVRADALTADRIMEKAVQYGY
jgi:hypothetical protein